LQATAHWLDVVEKQTDSNESRTTKQGRPHLSGPVFLEFSLALRSV
jgi:hypothetical protein